MPHLRRGACGQIIIGEVLVCHRDTRNRHDPFVVATCKGTTVVEHVLPRRISSICYVFLGKPGANITCSIAGSSGCRNVLVVAK